LIAPINSFFPYKPRIIVYYCGSNDVGGGEPAGAIIGRTKQFLKIAGERLPDTFVYYTAIQKAPDKRDRWDVVETVNREMERYSHQAKNLWRQRCRFRLLEPNTARLF
jgi:hypothetical protein